MLFKEIATAGTVALLLVTCASCRTESLDADGDGVITKPELVAALADHVCGADSSDDETAESDDGSTDDGTSEASEQTDESTEPGGNQAGS